MDFLDVTFAVSGVRTNLLLPPLVAFLFSYFSSLGGISGAFLILPFQVSALHYTAPSVSATNLVFNIVAIPGGVYRFIRERRMNWPLAGILMTGTLPGLIAGYYIRVLYFPDPRRFKLFVGCVLLYLAVRIARDVLDGRKPGGGVPVGKLRAMGMGTRTIEFTLGERAYRVSTPGVCLLAGVVGVIGGIYGIGGGAIISPFLVSVMGLPVYAVAGATLLATFMTSVAGVIFYSVLPGAGPETSPDWALGALFGAGGFLGIYLGARTQRYMPQRAIKAIIGAVLFLISYRYAISPLLFK